MSDTIKELEARLNALDQQAKALFSGKKLNGDLPTLLQLRALTDETDEVFTRLQAVRGEKTGLDTYRKSVAGWEEAVKRLAALIDLRVRARQLLDVMAAAQSGLEDQVRACADGAEVSLRTFTDPGMRAEAEAMYHRLNSQMTEVIQAARNQPGS